MLQEEREGSEIRDEQTEACAAAAGGKQIPPDLMPQLLSNDVDPVVRGAGKRAAKRRI